MSHPICRPSSCQQISPRSQDPAEPKRTPRDPGLLSWFPQPSAPEQEAPGQHPASAGTTMISRCSKDKNPGKEAARRGPGQEVSEQQGWRRPRDAVREVEGRPLPDQGVSPGDPTPACHSLRTPLQHTASTAQTSCPSGPGAPSPSLNSERGIYAGSPKSIWNHKVPQAQSQV